MDTVMMREQQTGFEFDLFDLGGFTPAQPAQHRIDDWETRERVAREAAEAKARAEAEKARRKAERERKARARAEEANEWARRDNEERQRARSYRPAQIDPYSVLGVNYMSTASEIRKAWASLCKANHPDVGGSLDAIKTINAAYNLLKKGARR